MRAALERRKEEARRRFRRKSGKKKDPGGSEGELISRLAADVRLIEVRSIRKDARFHTVRIHSDPIHPEWASNEGQHKSDLLTSMEDDGMKQPITVYAVDEREEDFILVAGERRLDGAAELGWLRIPAIVYPCWVPEVVLYNANLADLTRKTLTTYEAACAAKWYRDELKISPAEFCRTTGYSQPYVSNLLGCIDRLPPYLVEQWRDGARISLDQWINLSYLEPEQAIKLYRKLAGMSPSDRLKQAQRRGRGNKLPPRWLLERMMKLYEGVSGSDLPPRVRDLVLRVIEFCENIVDDVPGVYDPGKHEKYAKKAKLRAELALPDLPGPGEAPRDMPAPVDDDESDYTPDDDDQEDDDGDDESGSDREGQEAAEARLGQRPGGSNSSDQSRRDGEEVRPLGTRHPAIFPGRGARRSPRQARRVVEDQRPPTGRR